MKFLNNVSITKYAGNKVLISDASDNVAESSVTSTELGYLSGVTSAIQTQLNGLMVSSSATLPATIGWYRIATSPSSITRCSGRFEIDWTFSGIQGLVIIDAGIMYGQDPTINQTHYAHYSTSGLTKARIVYHTTYSGNYAYLEVYNSSASALVVSVRGFSLLGWTLVTPSTTGSIPTGYSNQELTFIDGIATEGVLSSSVSTGTAPLQVTSTTKVTNLNVDKLDDQEGSYYLDYNNFTNKPAVGSGTPVGSTRPIGITSGNCWIKTL